MVAGHEASRDQKTYHGSQLATILPSTTLGGILNAQGTWDLNSFAIHPNLQSHMWHHQSKLIALLSLDNFESSMPIAHTTAAAGIGQHLLIRENHAVHAGQIQPPVLFSHLCNHSRIR